MFRLLRLTTNYPTYLREFYSSRKELSSAPYEVQYRTLMEDCFGWADFWTQVLEELGYRVWEPVANAEPMQRAWAREKSCHYAEKTWFEEISLGQVKDFRPDVLFLDDYISFSREQIERMRSETPSIKLVLGWCGAPFNEDGPFSAYDIVLSNIPEFVSAFRELGHRAEYLRHAFHSNLLEVIANRRERAIDFSFVGSVMKGSAFHEERRKLLSRLAEKTDIKIFSETGQESAALGIRERLREKIENVFPVVNFFSRNRDSEKRCTVATKPPVFGKAMFEVLANSKVTLNNHIAVSPHSASNMRLFEATGVGACLLTDWKDNIRELFVPESEVVTYRSSDECIEKLNWLLEHPEKRAEIGEAGKRRTLSEHTFQHRAQELDELIKKYLSENSKGKSENESKCVST